MELLPCLICGESVIPLVKEEIAADTTYEPGNLAGVTVDLVQGPEGAVDFVEVGNKEKSLGGESKIKGWTEEEKSLYYWFTKWFNVVSVLTSNHQNKRKKKVLLDKGWDTESGKEKFPFCEQCKGQLSSIWELQCKVEELQRQIGNGVDVVKEKAEENEVKFRNGDVYRRDCRYRNIRKRIVSCFQNDSSISTVNVKPNPESVEKPVERRKSVRRLDADEWMDGCSFMNHLPVVLMSRVDTRNAEECLRFDQDIKPDISEIGPETTIAKRQNKKPKRKRKSTVLQRKDRAPRAIIKEDDEDVALGTLSTYFSDDNRDSDFDPDLREPPKRKGKSTKKHEKKEDSSYEDTDTDEDEGLDFETGKRKQLRFTIDKETGSITCKNMTFQYIGESLYKCHYCDDLITHELNGRARNIRAHLLRKHWNKYKCPKPNCSFRGTRIADLKSHTHKVHGGDPYPRQYKSVNCTVCGKPVRNVTQKIHLHMWSHYNEEEKRRKIEAGDKDIPSYYEKRHICEDCGKDLASKSAMANHKIRYHVTPEEQAKWKVLCPQCGGVYFEFDLREHLSTHEVKEKIYKCLEGENCTFAAVSMTALKKHKEAVHRKNRPHACTLCPRSFASKLCLKAHLNTHLGIRPFQCSHCPMAFATKSTMERHERLYHTEGVQPPKRKPYIRGPSLLKADVTKRDLQNEGKYLPPSALASWAHGRQPTSHILTEDGKYTDPTVVETEPPDNPS